MAVVADHMGAAKKGLAALEISWDEGANAKLRRPICFAAGAGREAQGVVAKQQGDVASRDGQAVKTLEADYQVPLLAHATMEPLNCTVHVRATAARSGPARRS